MHFKQKIDLLAQLGVYMTSMDASWERVKELALRKNYWFIPEFIQQATEAIATQFLTLQHLHQLLAPYDLKESQDIDHDQTLGIIMAGNIPLVGFHDFMMGFLAGYKLVMKPSSKDEVLIKHLVQKLIEWAPELKERFVFQDRLKGCEVYIATGSNNSAQTFQYYFSKYPSLIRHNRTSIAVLTGEETEEELRLLTKDIFSYFGMGCRNVSKLWVPENYDFKPLIQSINQYALPKQHHQYLNNYDYQLALVMLNGVEYMSADQMILVPSTSDFAPVSTLHYQEYKTIEDVNESLKEAKGHLQVIVSHQEQIEERIPFGATYTPSILDFADGEDTFAFLLNQRKR